MTISLSDISYLKSVTVTDSGLNGGMMSNNKVISGARHSLFPRVTKSQRINGLTRCRKQFWKNSNVSNDAAYDLLQWIEVPSNAGDSFAVTMGTHTDIQSEILTPSAWIIPQWVGSGFIQVIIAEGATSVQVAMETNGFVFPNGGTLHIANKVQTSQNIAVGVVIGDSVTYASTSWQKITATQDITYPKGVYLGSNRVLSLRDTTKEEWLLIAECMHSESIGTGSGGVSPTLTAPTYKTRGISQTVDKLPIISSLSAADVAITVYLRQDGSVNTAISSASAGKLNMDTGAWITPITWTTAPGLGKDITITYREKSYSYSGNVATVLLDDQASNSYAIADTIAGVCLKSDIVVAGTSTPVITSVAGTFDNVASPVIAHNIGAVRDTITLTFTSGTAYNITGTNLGSLGSSFTGSSPVVKHPETNANMFTINGSAWGGTRLTGDTLVFELYPAAVPMWIKETIPTATPQENHNLCVFGYYLE